MSNTDAAFYSYQIKRVLPREGRSVGEWIRDTYRSLHKDDDRWTHTRTESIWYEIARRIDAWEADSLRRATEARERREQDATVKHTIVKDEYQLLQERISRLEAAYTHGDEAFHRPQVDALRAQRCGVDISGNDGE